MLVRNKVRVRVSVVGTKTYMVYASVASSRLLAITKIIILMQTFIYGRNIGLNRVECSDKLGVKSGPLRQ